MRNIAVILAGGTGQRMGSSLPKQFMPLAGRTVIEHSIHTFNTHPDIDGVGIVVHPDWRNEMNAIIQRNQWDKLIGITDGGSERHLSTLAAIQAFGEPHRCNFLLHDAARPLIDAATINRIVSALGNHKAVSTAIPSTDTVYYVDNGEVDHVPQRSHIWLAQTPQAFHIDLLCEAYRRMETNPDFKATDDCSLVRHYMPEVRIKIVEGSPLNFKITHPNDLRRAEAEILAQHE